MIVINKNTYVVFDLDDTLYKERDYSLSGLEAVARFVQHTYGIELGAKLLEWQQQGVKDVLQALCDHLQLESSVKESFLWVYRLHEPTIQLSPENRDLIKAIQEVSAGVAILTDGRSTTQRLKIRALGLHEIPCYISEDWQSEKPDPKRFIEINNTVEAERFIYIGDNPKKDFKAPNELGWQTIGLIGNELNVHSQKTDHLTAEYLPTVWIHNLSELLDFVSKK